MNSAIEVIANVQRVCVRWVIVVCSLSCLFLGCDKSLTSR
jgi:hypothetical protein